ncbi:NADH-quinone oxidoreductase subunit A like [Actinidia chinensis var. chinensis]|uniref:NADH-quinone oxidoreductase subunit A like n=1 Tax=Actinidia chinensis var. chinensis TaxID=1590841 RepID=A0A2R6PD16_ACTCC|nr:NADH-quinone oxidoreductase subunit A like [Actinidia chinensis var. chinensis]
MQTARQDLDIVTQDMSTVVERRRRLDKLETAMTPPKTVSPIWCSPLLEELALKWTPIGIIIIVAVVLIWSRLILTKSFTIMTFKTR